MDCSTIIETPRRVQWTEQPTVKTYVSQHQYEKCIDHLERTPIDSSFTNSSCFKAASFMMGDECESMLLITMATNYLRDKLGRYPDGDELFSLLTENGLTHDVIVDHFLSMCMSDGRDEHVEMRNTES